MTTTDASTTAPLGRKSTVTIGVFEKAKDEFYPTPPALTLGMLGLEQFYGGIWEPACGDGALSKLMVEAGHSVISTDLIDRGYGEGGVDFLKEEKLRAPNIVTNPPFKLWARFAEHALKLGADKVVLMNQMSILGNVGTSALMERTSLARMLVATGRVAILPPGAADLGHSPRHGNYAWFVWERGHSGNAVIKNFSPRQYGYCRPRKARTDVAGHQSASAFDGAPHAGQ